MSLLIPNQAACSSTHQGTKSAPARRRGVLLINTGSPEKPDVPSVRKYLAEFLSDPMVIHLPKGMGWFQGLLGRLIARFRAPHSTELYRRIWTDRGFPLRATMEDLASDLGAALPDDWRVFVGMRYGSPGIETVMYQIKAAGIEELVVVPMFPQYSGTTTGSVAQELYRVLGRVGAHISVSTRSSWYDDAGYINAQAKLIAEYAAAEGLLPQDTHLLFSAHGLPVSYIEQGDPYLSHTQRTAELVTARLGWPAERASLSFQSRLGPAEWLKPDTREYLPQLAQAGEKKVLVCPISFPVDCLETIDEIGTRYREVFEATGGRLYLCPALNRNEAFTDALKNLVLRRPQPLTSRAAGKTPLLGTEHGSEPADADLKSLVLIGTSLQGAIGPGLGPRLRFSEPDDLSCVKKPQDEVHVFLQNIRREGSANEALVWNTCHRIEFYGWLKNPDDAADRECVVARLRHQLYGSEPDGLNVYVLFGVEAWHHLMRTVVGLNSGLPGDRDVCEQLQTGFRMAEHAGTAGPRARQLVNEAVALAADLRDQTAWSSFSPGYCYAAMSRLRDSAELDLPEQRHVVIGGSTTSRSVLDTLAEDFEVSKRQMTLVYRGHRGGQMKLLRKAIGNGRRVRVQSYSERTVLQAIADADVVFFGIDHDKPALQAEDLRGLRDFSKRPLTIIDFNTLGSTHGVEEIDGVSLWNAQRLELEVAAYADEMARREEFAPAVEQAEDWIKERLPASCAPYLALPCLRDGPGARPACAGCWRTSAPGQALTGSDAP